MGTLGLCVVELPVSMDAELCLCSLPLFPVWVTYQNLTHPSQGMYCAENVHGANQDIGDVCWILLEIVDTILTLFLLQLSMDESNSFFGEPQLLCLSKS